MTSLFLSLVLSPVLLHAIALLFCAMASTTPDVHAMNKQFNLKPTPPGGSTPRGGILRPGQTMLSHIGHSVINLSTIDLTENQTKALTKGLTFCPTPWEPDMSSIINNLEDFFRKMRLKVYFHTLAKNADEAAYAAKMEENRGKKGRKKASSFTSASSTSIANYFSQSQPTVTQPPLDDQFGKNS